MTSSDPLFDIRVAIENNNYWSIIRNINESIMIVTGSYPHMFLYCSLQWEKLTGYVNESLFGFNMSDLLFQFSDTSNVVHNDNDNEVYNSFLKDLYEFKSSHCVITIKSADNRQIKISLHASTLFKFQYDKLKMWNDVDFYMFSINVLDYKKVPVDSPANDKSTLFKIESFIRNSLNNKNVVTRRNSSNSNAHKGLLNYISSHRSRSLTSLPSTSSSSQITDPIINLEAIESRFKSKSDPVQIFYHQNKELL
jgi:hypothetical protein